MFSRSWISAHGSYFCTEWAETTRKAHCGVKAFYDHSTPTLWQIPHYKATPEGLSSAVSGPSVASADPLRIDYICATSGSGHLLLVQIPSESTTSVLRLGRGVKNCPGRQASFYVIIRKILQNNWIRYVPYLYSRSQKTKHMILLKCPARVRAVQQLITRSQNCPFWAQG